MWKKLFFIPFLIVAVIGSVVYANTLLSDPIASFFSGHKTLLDAFLPYIYLSLALTIAGLLFGLIVMLSNNWLIPSFVSLFCALIPLLMIVQTPLNFILGGGFLLCFILEMLLILHKMNSYVTFSGSGILLSPIKMMLLFLSLVLTYGYYSAAVSEISTKGFSIPDPLIDAAISVSGVNGSSGGSTSTTPTTPALPNINLSKEQIAQLKQNPALLSQFGITAKDLDLLLAKPNTTNPSSSASSENNLIKTMVKNQLDDSIKPYVWIVPSFFAFSFFGLLISFIFLLLFFYPLLIWLLFIILEKSGFIQFEKELREVKKLVV